MTNFINNISATNNNAIKVVTHDGQFHADDVLCLALLKEEFPEVDFEVKRSRKDEDIQKADIVFDVGKKDLITENKIMVDHHQMDEQNENGWYENGFKKAAVGKLAEIIFKNEDPRFTGRLRDKLLYGIELQDNGETKEEHAMRYKNLLSFVNDMNGTWKESIYGPEQDKRFLECVEMAQVIYRHVKKVIKADIESLALAHKLEEHLKKEPEYVVVNQYFPGWISTVAKHNNTHNPKVITKLGVVKSSDTQWNVQVVPKSEIPGVFGSHIDLPKEWLDNPPEGNIFVHPKLFISGWKTREAAENAAKLVLDIK